MHPGFYGWWKHARGQGGGCGSQAECGPGGGGGGGGEHRGWGHGWGRGGHGGWEASGDDEGGAPFGVRRPLRFLAFKLGLDEKQIGELARVLSDLKTERAQAAVDSRRAVTALADVVASDSFDAGRAAAVAAERAKSAERLNGAIAGALAKIHALLNAEQRAQLAYLIRTGALQI